MKWYDKVGWWLIAKGKRDKWMLTIHKWHPLLLIAIAISPDARRQYLRNRKVLMRTARPEDVTGIVWVQIGEEAAQMQKAREQALARFK